MPPREAKPVELLPEQPMRHRDASSVAILARRVREVACALAAGDEDAARSELRMLADEARLLSSMIPLLPSSLERRRQRVAIEREPKHGLSGARRSWRDAPKKILEVAPTLLKIERLKDL